MQGHHMVMCGFPHLSLSKSQGGNPSYVPNLLEATSCQESGKKITGGTLEVRSDKSLTLLTFDIRTFEHLNIWTDSYLVQIKNNWDSISGKIPSKKFYISIGDSPSPSSSPAIPQPTLWFYEDCPNTPGHTSLQRAPDQTTSRLTAPECERLMWIFADFDVRQIDLWLWGDMVLCWGPKS